MREIVWIPEGGKDRKELEWGKLWEKEVREWETKRKDRWKESEENYEKEKESDNRG